MRIPTGIALVAAAILAALPLAGCSPERDPNELFAPEDIGRLVVDGRLIVGERLPAIRLSRTQAPGEPFAPGSSGESDAAMTLRIAGVTTVEYRELTGWPGRYIPLDAAGLTVAPQTLYELEVVTVGGERLAAATMTPALFRVDDWVLLDSEGEHVIRELKSFADAGDSVYVAPENQLVYSLGLIEARFAETAVLGYQIALFSLDLDSDFVIDPPFFDEEDFASLERSGSSPPLVAESGTLRLPWFAVYFAGRHLYKIFAVDRNWYDLIRTTPRGGTPPPQAGPFSRPVSLGAHLFGITSLLSSGRA